MRSTGWLVVVVSVLGAGATAAAPRPARPTPVQPAQPLPAQPLPAQPLPAQPGQAVPADKLDAKALMQSGLKLFAAKDFLGALAVFRTAYTRFPSAKILLNIGTTLTRLDRKAAAANVYQHYLDAPDADPAKQPEVKRVLAELDTAVATLELSITPGDAELQVNDEDWRPAASEPRHRVAAGPVIVRARHAGYTPDEQAVRATAGEKLAVVITLAEIPAPPAPPAPAATTAAPGDGGVRALTVIEPPRSRVAVIALAHIDITHRGGAGVVGMAVNLTGGLHAQAAAILGPSYGGYAGASYEFFDGAVRPLVSAGLPIFISQGARVALRVAGGVELAVNRHFALIGELGVEHLFNPEADVQRTLFIPAIGAAGRL